MIRREIIQSINADFPQNKRNLTNINENDALYEGAVDGNADEADYSAAISVKAVRLG